MVLPVLFGVASAASGIMGAFGKRNEAIAQANAANQAAANRYRDALKMRSYQFNKELGVFQQRKADFASGIQESRLALQRGFTQIQQRGAERLGAAAVAGEQNLIKDIQTQGKFAALQPGGSRDRAAIMARAAAGRRDALITDNLLRARYADIAKGRELVNQANSYRRKLFSSIPLAPTMAPVPSKPVFQQGPSTLSLLSGIGSSILGGITAGMSMNSMMGGGGGGGLPGGGGSGGGDPLSQLNSSASNYGI